MKNLFITALALGVAFSAGADQPLFKVPSTSTVQGLMKSRNGVKGMAAKKTTSFAKGPSRTIGWGGDAISEVDKLGTLRVVLSEDFSRLTDGTEDEPSRYTDLTISPDDKDFEYPWWNFKPEYTSEPHWGVAAMDGAVACPAGGCLYLEMTLDDRGALNQAHVNTPPLKVDEDGAIAVIEFRARTKNAGETYDYLYIEAGETNNMGPTWRTVDEPTIVTGIPSQWTKYRIIFRDAGPSTLFNLVGMGPGNVYIDDIKVYQLKPYVDVPVTTAHTDYKGTSFTANWNPVDGADKYLMTMWYIETIPAEHPMQPDTEVRHDVFVDREVIGTSYEVTGVESGETYYYTVKAVKGDKISLESFETRVYDLEKPVFETPKQESQTSYSATWNNVPGADVYNYWAYDKRIADVDGLFVVTDEDFTGVLLEDGTPTGLTKEEPGEEVYPDYYSRELKQQGWHGTNCCPYEDYVALDAWHYYAKGETSGFFSPELDLSKDNGKFTFYADLAGQIGTAYYQDGTSADVVTQGVAALFNWNETMGDYEQVELVYPTNEVTEDFESFEFPFTKGSDRSIVAICAVGNYQNLYVDNIKLTQNYKAGESLLEPFLVHRYHGSRAGETPNAITVEVPAHAQGYEVYHKVSAYSHKPDKWGQSYDARESKYSDLTYVMKTVSGVDEIVTEVQGRAYAEGMTIRVANPNAEVVSVYTAQGVQLYSGNAAELRLPVADMGVYMVRIGVETFKLAL